MKILGSGVRRAKVRRHTLKASPDKPNMGKTRPPPLPLNVADAFSKSFVSEQRCYLEGEDLGTSH